MKQLLLPIPISTEARRAARSTLLRRPETLTSGEWAPGALDRFERMNGGRWRECDLRLPGEVFISDSRLD